VRFFVFVDTPYYPYVADPIEASSAPEAERLAIEREQPSLGEAVYVCAASCVRGGPMQGPRRKPVGMLALMERANRYRSDMLEAKNLSGGFTVRVDAGSVDDV
jgi:hypothetical protein